MLEFAEVMKYVMCIKCELRILKSSLKFVHASRNHAIIAVSVLLSSVLSFDFSSTFFLYIMFVPFLCIFMVCDLQDMLVWEHPNTEQCFLF